jgi:hypothetical protein
MTSKLRAGVVTLFPCNRPPRVGRQWRGLQTGREGVKTQTQRKGRVEGVCAKRDDRQGSVERSDGLGQKRTKQTRMRLNAWCCSSDSFRSWTRDARGPDTHNIGFSFARWYQSLHSTNGCWSQSGCPHWQHTHLALWQPQYAMHADKNKTNSSRNSSPRTLLSTPNQNAFYLNFAPFPSHPCHRPCDTVTPHCPVACLSLTPMA